MPHLHTLLIIDSGAEPEWGSIDSDSGPTSFYFAYDLEFQRELLSSYETYAPKLRRVAFTTEFEWEKGPDGWWYLSEDVDPQTGLEPYDSDSDHLESDSDADDGSGDDSGGSRDSDGW